MWDFVDYSGLAGILWNFWDSLGFFKTGRDFMAFLNILRDFMDYLGLTGILWDSFGSLGILRDLVG